MSEFKLLLPKMGESVAEATLIKWGKTVGDLVEIDEVVVEIATDKVDSEVPSPVSGTLKQILKNENEVAQVGEAIAIIEIAGYGDQNTTETTSSEEDLQFTQLKNVDAAMVEEPEKSIQSSSTDELYSKKEAIYDDDRFYSPLIKNIAKEEGIGPAELNSIKGSGTNGRLTKEDIFTYLKNRTSGNKQKDSIISAPATETAPTTKHVPTSVNTTSSGDEIIEMDRMRKLIADHMVMSKQVSPHVTSFVEVDVTNLVLWREKNKKAYEARENEKITYTPVFIECVIKALKDFPMVNVSVNQQQIIKKKDINIGMATALPGGNLIVPVIKKADQLNLVGLSKIVNNLAERARNNKLLPDETQGGTFTITNIGTFGNIMGTPIINQPQVAILAIGAIQKKPAVLETEYGDTIAIRHKMYLSLAYDHRVVDGALGGSFLRRIADYMEAWNINRNI